MMNEEIIAAAAIIALSLLGLFSHFLKKVMEYRKNGTPITLKQYYLSNPYQSLLSVFLCFAGLLILWGTEELTKATAFTLGYMADSAVAIINKRKLEI